MARGRPRNSEATTALRGNAGKRARPKAAPAVAPAPAAAPGPASEWDPPPHVVRDIAAIWRRELPRLRDAGFLRASDLSAFEVYCVARFRWEKACRVITRRGMTYTSTSKHGDMERERPEMKIIAAAERTIRSFMDGLAMTTSARMRAAGQLANGQGRLPLPDPAASREAATTPRPAQINDFDPVGYVQ